MCIQRARRHSLFMQESQLHTGPLSVSFARGGVPAERIEDEGEQAVSGIETGGRT